MGSRGLHPSSGSERFDRTRSVATATGLSGDLSHLTMGPSSVGFMDLSDDALFLILSFCDVQSLGRLSLVCRRLRNLIRQDCVWVATRRKIRAPANVRKTFKLVLASNPSNASSILGYNGDVKCRMTSCSPSIWHTLI